MSSPIFKSFYYKYLFNNKGGTVGFSQNHNKKVQ